MLAPIEFDVSTPDEDIAGHVRSAMSRGLPELTIEPERLGALNVIANGPSALNAPLLGVTLALNGALKLFTDAGLAPTYWAAVDPQAMVADFLSESPEETTYLVASRCHPSVFEALKNRKVILWHADDSEGDEGFSSLPVPAICSITITCFEVMSRLGFRRFETWGWDGCYLDGKAHATDQGTGGSFKTVNVGEKSFSTTTNWCLEAQAAYRYLQMLPRDITVHGPGMIGEILRYLGGSDA